MIQRASFMVRRISTNSPRRWREERENISLNVSIPWSASRCCCLFFLFRPGNNRAPLELRGKSAHLRISLLSTSLDALSSGFCMNIVKLFVSRKRGKPESLMKKSFNNEYNIKKHIRLLPVSYFLSLRYRKLSLNFFQKFYLTKWLIHIFLLQNLLSF